MDSESLSLSLEDTNGKPRIVRLELQIQQGNIDQQDNWDIVMKLTNLCSQNKCLPVTEFELMKNFQLGNSNQQLILLEAL